MVRRRNHRPKTLGKASFFGVISSSCSYASSALAKSLFARGADITAATVFMIASTNLVVELSGTNRHAAHEDDQTVEDSGPLEQEPLRRRLRSRRGWGDASGYTISDLTMLRRELVIGFVVAGYLAALVPNAFWRSLFLTGHGFWSSLENVVLGPFLAIISFVCSVGNVPLAAALWQGDISFGGGVSFVFADLITLPLLSIYRRYFGTAIALRILAISWAVMSIGGLAVEYLFRLVGIADPTRPTMIIHTGFQWNCTSVLNILALAAFAAIYWLYRHRDTASAQYAEDPVCGMQVETQHAPASRLTHGGPVYFCSDHCAHRFEADPGANLPVAGPHRDDVATLPGGAR